MRVSRNTMVFGLLVLVLTVGTWQVLRVARADDGDDTLKRWLDRSDAVVDATIHGFEGPFYNEVGVANYAVELEVHAMLKGRELPPPPPEARQPGEPTRPRARIVRFESNEADHLPWLKDGARAVLFLKALPQGNFPAHQTADFWFGVQPYGPWLVRRLGELAKPVR